MKMYTFNLLLLSFCLIYNVRGLQYVEMTRPGAAYELLFSTTVTLDGKKVAERQRTITMSKADRNTIVLGDIGKAENNNYGWKNLMIIKEYDRILEIKTSGKDSVSDLNFKRAIASMLLLPTTDFGLSYVMKTDNFGACEAAIENEMNLTTVTRNLDRCSSLYKEVVHPLHDIPILHLLTDTAGSRSKCNYIWMPNKWGLLNEIYCTDDIVVGLRFSQIVTIINVETTLSINRELDFNDSIVIADFIGNDKIQADSSIDSQLTYLHHQSVEISELSKLLKQLCQESDEYSNKFDIYLRIVEAFARSDGIPPQITQDSCPIFVRRAILFTTVIIGGPKSLSFVYEQIKDILDSKEELFSSIEHPLASIAIAKLGKIGTYVNPENEHYIEKIVDLLLISGTGSLTGIAGLLENIRSHQPELFERLILKASHTFSPEEACENGKTAEATKILFATSSLKVRHPTFLVSLRPCFETENIAIQVAAVKATTKLSCSTPGALELQSLAMESPSDPEIRIASYQGLVKCTVQFPQWKRNILNILDPSTPHFSYQLASYVYSHVSSVMNSNDPKFYSLRAELRSSDDDVFQNLNDPVVYDMRRHSRHLENTFIINPRTGVTIYFDAVWGRTSLFPRSFEIEIRLLLDGVSYEVVKIFIRFTGIESFIWDIPGTKYLWNLIFSQSESSIWNVLQNTASNILRNKRDIKLNDLSLFIEKIKSHIPYDYMTATGNFEFSFGLFGQPCYHNHLNSLQDGFNILDKWSSVFNLKIFQLIPLMDSSLDMASNGGLPINIHIGSLVASKFLISKFIDTNMSPTGNFKSIFVNGLITKIKTTIGEKYEDGMKKGNESFEKENHLLTKFSLPINFKYDLMTKKLIRWYRPAELPFYLLEHRHYTTINGLTSEISMNEQCLLDNEPLNICYESEPLFEGSSHYLTEEFSRNRAFKIVFPAGIGPVLLNISNHKNEKDQ